MIKLQIALLAIALLPALGTQTTNRLEEMKQRLDLTPQQEEQVRPILQQELEKAKAVVQNLDRDSASRRQKMKAARELKSIQEDADKQLKTILTKEQMAELKRIREERREEMKSRKGGRASARGGI